MKTFLTLVAFAASTLTVLPAQAADATVKAPSAQQSRMKQCNGDAKGLKGPDRRAFMKQCLSKKPA